MGRQKSESYKFVATETTQCSTLHFCERPLFAPEIAMFDLGLRKLSVLLK